MSQENPSLPLLSGDDRTSLKTGSGIEINNYSTLTESFLHNSVNSNNILSQSDRQARHRLSVDSLGRAINLNQMNQQESAQNNGSRIGNGNINFSGQQSPPVKKKIIYSHCHVQQESSCGHENKEIDKSARRRLIAASVICLVFMIGEIVGGILSNSLAIATDAAHLLTDFASFMISLFAIWLSSRPATRNMSFGWYRAEVIGALMSVLMIWLVTGLLVYMAVERLRTQQFEIDSIVMVITASAGLLVNIIMAVALNVDGHGHSHGGHFHSHGGHTHSHNHSRRSEVDEDQSHDREKTVASSSKQLDIEATTKRPHQHAKSQSGRGKSNINVRAAFIHVVGDFLQSVGVLIAALVIHYRPDYAIVDPICTFLFSIIVLVTTINIIKDAINVLMEGMPDGVNFIEVRESLQDLKSVIRVHNLRIW